MKAIRVHEFGDPGRMLLEDVPDPIPGPGQVVVKILAVGVNPVETYIRSGTYHLKPPLPYTPGNDGAGVVKTVGEGVGRVSKGDRVYTAGAITGTYAEQALCHESQVYRLPQGVSFAQGATVNVPYSAAYHALFQRARAIPGDIVLVHGATGSVGIAAVQLARSAGMTVIGTGGTVNGRDLVMEQGARHVLNHSVPGYLDQVLALTRGRGVDVILEMLANVNLGRDLCVLARYGRVVVIGSRGPVEINPRDAMIRSVSILGMLLLNATPQEIESIHAAIGAGLENGTLQPVAGKELPLAEAPQAHCEVMTPGAYGKIVLIP